GGVTDYQGETFETVTWAAGLLVSTQRLVVFGTVHAPLIAPLIAAKEFVTADHIGEGRFGLNLVCGWNEGEFEMFGANLRDHETRYDYAQDREPRARRISPVAQSSGKRHGRTADGRRPGHRDRAIGAARRCRPHRHCGVLCQLSR